MLSEISREPRQPNLGKKAKIAPVTVIYKINVKKTSVL